MGSPRTRLVVAPENLRGFRGLTLDAFGSLLDGGPGRVSHALREAVAKRRHVPGNQSIEDLWRVTFRKHIRADPFLTFQEVHRRSVQDIFARFGISDGVDDCVDGIFDEYRHAKAYAEVSSVLRELERDVPIAVISNTDTRILLEALQTNGLAFNFVITSDEEQRYKPDPALFRRAVRYLGLPAGHIVHVGDSYAEDIVGATLIGMPSLLIQRPGGSAEPKGEAKALVHDLAEVREFIRSSWDES